MAGHRYSIKKNRIQQGYYPGFVLQENGNLITDMAAGTHYLYIKALDSGVQDAQWGRLHLETEIPETSALYVYAVALNEDSFYRNYEPVKIQDFLCSRTESNSVKKEFFERVSAQKTVNQKDVLLYGLTGRYLYIAIELLGEDRMELSNIRVEQQGDNFMNTFPEIYQERNGFFHRYLSVFSTMYNDFQEDINGVFKLLDLDTCPAELLPIYGRWMGIEVNDDFMEEEWLRLLVKEAYQLNRMKGTKQVIERVSEIVLGEPVIVLENNKMKEYIAASQMEKFRALYGSSHYNVTILVKKYISETLKAKLLFLLNQFKPIRCSVHVFCLRQTGTLDSHSYLDMNAKVIQQEGGCLDERQMLDDVTYLQ